jgi:hypothetical protein
MSEIAWNWKNLRRLALFVTIPFLSALSVVGSAGATEQQKEPDLEMGHRLVEARCVVCHRQKSLCRLPQAEVPPRSRGPLHERPWRGVSGHFSEAPPCPG